MAAPSPPAAPRMSAGIRFKLSLMMFLQFFIWGAWFEIGFSYIPALGFSGWQNILVFGAMNVAALVALFFSAQFADRTFAAQKFLAVSHLLGGLAILGLFFVRPEVIADLFSGSEPEFQKTLLFVLFFGLMLLHALFYIPTISITNSIAFANLTDPSRQFGPIRVWGTIGWIAASWPFIFILVDWANVPEFGTVGTVEWMEKALGSSLSGAAASNAQRYIFLVAGLASLVLAGFSLLLPHTPPKPASGLDSLAWLKAMKLLKHPFVLVLFIVTFIDAAVHQSFFYWTYDFLTGPVGVKSNWAGPVMKIGQIAEILTMLVLGYVLKSLGWRMTMTIGVLGHAGRFAVFAFFPEQTEAIVLVNVLHGICYAFFFATVYIFVDEYFPKDIRSSAQGLFNVLILGVGPFAANTACGILKEEYGERNVVDGKETFKMVDYSVVFLVSMFAALFGAILLAALFHPRKSLAEASK